MPIHRKVSHCAGYYPLMPKIFCVTLSPTWWSHTTRAKSLSSWHRLAHVYLKIPRFPTCVSIWGILYTMKYGAQEFLAPAFSEKIEPKKSSLKLSNSNNYLCPRGLVDCDEMGAQPTVHVVAWDLKKHNPLKYPQISLQVEVPWCINRCHKNFNHVLYNHTYN